MEAKAVCLLARCSGGDGGLGSVLAGSLQWPGWGPMACARLLAPVVVRGAEPRFTLAHSSARACGRA